MNDIKERFSITLTNQNIHNWLETLRKELGVHKEKNLELHCNLNLSLTFYLN